MSLTHNDRDYINDIMSQHFLAVVVSATHQPSKFIGEDLLGNAYELLKLFDFLQNRELQDYEDPYHGDNLRQLKLFVDENQSIIKRFKKTLDH